MKKIFSFIFVSVTLFAGQRELFNVSLLHTNHQNKHRNGIALAYTDRGMAYMFEGAKDYFAYKVAKELIVNKDGDLYYGALLHGGYERFNYESEAHKEWNRIPFLGIDLIYAYDLDRSVDLVGEVSLSASLNREDLFSIFGAKIGCRYKGFRIDFATKHYAPSKSYRNSLLVGYTFNW